MFTFHISSSFIVFHIFSFSDIFEALTSPTRPRDRRPRGARRGHICVRHANGDDIRTQGRGVGVMEVSGGHLAA